MGTIVTSTSKTGERFLQRATLVWLAILSVVIVWHAWMIHATGDRLRDGRVQAKSVDILDNEREARGTWLAVGNEAALATDRVECQELISATVHGRVLKVDTIVLRAASAEDAAIRSRDAGEGAIVLLSINGKLCVLDDDGSVTGVVTTASGE